MHILAAGLTGYFYYVASSGCKEGFCFKIRVCVSLIH